MNWTLERLRPRPKIASSSLNIQRKQTVTPKVYKRKKFTKKNDKKIDNLLEVHTGKYIYCKSIKNSYKKNIINMNAIDLLSYFIKLLLHLLYFFYRS
jgi:hypothetical protein